MRRQVVTLVIFASVIGGGAYAALGHGDSIAAMADQVALAPFLLLFGVMIGMLVSRPRRQSFSERSSSRRWRRMTQGRWKSVPKEEFKHGAFQPVTWGPSNWLTRAEGKKIINIWP